MRTLVLAAFGMSPYAERALELLQLAGRGDDAECRGIVAEAKDGATRLRGLALYGTVAGTQGGAKLHLCESCCAEADRAARIRDSLIAAAVERLERVGARYVVAELPDDPWFSAMRQSLATAGFVEEGRVRDLWREGVDMIFLRRTSGASPARA